MTRRVLTTGTITTNAGGAATSTITVAEVAGALLHRVELVNTDFAAGVDVTISFTNTASGVDETVLTLTDANASAVYYPRTLEDDNVGAALSTYTLYQIVGDIKVVVASGGDTKTGEVLVSYIWN